MIIGVNAKTISGKTLNEFGIMRSYMIVRRCNAIFR